MRVRELFSKDLTRNINGVVKAEQLDEEIVWIELDEYVVTNELQRHFRSFFETYTPVINHPNDPNLANKTGVWVSGFFGSGKSHFIKILSYLLGNTQATNDGTKKRAIDFFNGKFEDPMLHADIHAAVNRDTDVILFNIDSRADTNDKEASILNVFLKVFNEYLGFSSDYPHVAHLERELSAQGQYETFKEEFKTLTGKEWTEQRHKYRFKRDQMIQALVKATGQSEDSAREMVSNLENHFSVDINTFTLWVKDYLNSHQDKRLLFFVDEVGQFVGNNTQMMLKLQTITEDLGKACGGRAWVVVTSQEDIDSVVGDMQSKKRNDFSKIQGRFSTKISLSSSNTNEVIQKRLLAKNDNAREILATLFAEKGDILKNQLAFDVTTTAELANYKDPISFIDNYPFIPYQYTLVQKVFEAIPKVGASGKHLSRGERSLLEAFQKAALRLNDADMGVLVPFHQFYYAIESFLDTSVKKTIDQACQLESLKEFDTEILKTLFLIRYVDVVKSTLDNLVTLAIDKIDIDKLALRRKIEGAVNRLEQQMLIARNSDEYVFLTNEEREIENEIRNTDVQPSTVNSELGDLIFDEVLKRDTAFTYPANKQVFNISRFCNSHPRDGSKLEDLVFKLISPLDNNYLDYHSQQCINTSLDGDGCIIAKLSDNKKLWDELSIYVKTREFLKQNIGKRPEQEILLREKSLENTERYKRLRYTFADLFINAEFYAIGKQLDPKSSNPPAMMQEAYLYVIENTFSKLNLLHLTANVLDELQATVSSDDITQLDLDLNAPESNANAMREVDEFVQLKVNRNQTVFAADIVERFKRRPFGWPNNEILLLIARLGLSGKITFNMNGPLSLRDSYDPLTTTRSRNKLRIERVVLHAEQEIVKATKLYKNLFRKSFNVAFTGSGEKELANAFREELGQWRDALKQFKTKSEMVKAPGKDLIEDGQVLLSQILGHKDSYGLIKSLLENSKDLQDFEEDYDSLDDFYNKQFTTWQKLANALNVKYKDNRTALDKDAQAKASLATLESIYNNKSPYGKLRQVEGLINQIEQVNSKLLEAERKKSETLVDNIIQSLMEQLNTLADSEKNRALYPLQQCKKRISTAHTLFQLISEAQQATELEDEAIDIINESIDTQEKERKNELARIVAEKAKKESKPDGDDLFSGITETAIADTSKQQKPYIEPQKKIVIISPSELLTKGVGVQYIETKEDIEHYLDTLRQQLMKAVDNNEKIRIK